MKRHTALIQLSREHHVALVLAKRAIQGSESDPEAVKHVAAEVARVFASDFEPHFQLEEKRLLPALMQAGQRKAVERTLAEHAELRALVGQGSINHPENLRRFGHALAEHVRYEERELFPLAESVLKEDALKSLWDDPDGAFTLQAIA